MRYVHEHPDHHDGHPHHGHPHHGHHHHHGGASFRFLFAGRRRGGEGPFGPGEGGRGGGHGGGGRGGPFGGGGFPPGFDWNPFRRGPRARRGDIRAAILALLQEQPRNGYQIMQELKQRTQGMWNPSPGSVYPALQQLEDERLIATEEKPGGRVYALTSEGKAYVEEHAEEIAAPWEALTNHAGDDFLEVMGLARQLGAATLQVLQAGDSKQIAKAKKVLIATRRSLYAILAEGSSEDA